ncbi:MAG: hypothetical protein V4565_05110 [Bacteroidota bacterium]
MIVFAHVYPFERANQIALEINVYNKQIAVLNEEASNLKSKVDKLEKLTNETLTQLEKTKKENNGKIAQLKIAEIQNSYNKIYNEVKQKEEDLVTKNIVLKYEKEKIKILQKQMDSFSYLKIFFTIAGAAFTIWGLVCWYLSTKISTKIHKLELAIKEKEAAKP